MDKRERVSEFIVIMYLYILRFVLSILDIIIIILFYNNFI